MIVSTKSNCDLGVHEGGDGFAGGDCFARAFDWTSAQNEVLWGSAPESPTAVVAPGICACGRSFDSGCVGAETAGDGGGNMRGFSVGSNAFRTRTSVGPLGKASEVVCFTTTCGAGAIVIGAEVFTGCFCTGTCVTVLDNLLSDGMACADGFKKKGMEPIKRSEGTPGGGRKIVDATVEETVAVLDSVTDGGGETPFGSRFSGRQEESKRFVGVRDTGDLRIPGELCSSLSVLDPGGVSRM